MSLLPPTKRKKIARALKSAARLPRIPSIRTGRASAASTAQASLKLQVLGCADVLAKDKGWEQLSVRSLFSQNVHFLILVCRFVVVTLLSTRQQAP